MRQYQIYFRKLTLMQWFMYYISPRSRKSFLIKNENIKTLVENNHKIFLELISDEVCLSYRNAREKDELDNTTCCCCKSKNIVDKISQVRGSGNVLGELFFGSGTIYRDSSLDTLSINHCNCCGHDWKKIWTVSVTHDNTHRNFLHSVMGKVLNKQYLFCKDRYAVLKEKGVSAEALYYAAYQEVRIHDHRKEYTELTLELLRKYFVSVLT